MPLLVAGVAALLVLGWLLLVFLIVPPVEVVTVAVILVTVLIVGGVTAVVVRSNRSAALSRRDKLTLGLMVGIPTAVLTIFILVPTVASLTLSFTSWNGIGGLDKIQFIGLQNYIDLHQVYKPFYPALSHNLIWLAVLPLRRHALGMFFAVLLDKNIRGTRFYQSALYMPVVLSLAIVGFIWMLIYSPDQGLLNNVLGTNKQGNLIDWLGDPSINLWAVLVAASWRHVGYVMVLYLAGLKAVDPTLREAAADRRRQRAADVLPGRLPGAEAHQHRGPRHHGHRVAAGVRPGLHHQQGPQRPGAAVDDGDQQHHRGDEPHRLRLGHRGGAAADLGRCPSSYYLSRALREDDA